MAGHNQNVMCEPLAYYYNGKIDECVSFNKHNLTFGKDVTVALDQSTTRTGLSILSRDGDVFLTEIARGEHSRRDYGDFLTTQLKHLCMNIDVKYFLFEEHGRHIAPVESVIHSVTDSLKAFSKQYGFRVFETHGIPPSVWRSGFLNSDEYAGQFTRDKVKKACMTQAIKEVPGLEAFIPYSGKDFDGFESYGIAKGFLNLNFDMYGSRIVNRCLKKNNFISPTYELVKCSFEELEGTLKILTNNGRTPVIMGNPSIRLEESVNRVCALYDECVIFYKNCPEFCRFVLEYQEPATSRDIFLVLVKKVR